MSLYYIAYADQGRLVTGGPYADRAAAVAARDKIAAGGILLELDGSTVFEARSDPDLESPFGIRSGDEVEVLPIVPRHQSSRS